MNSDYFAANDGGKLYYEVHGEGETILFIHGFSLDHRMWQPQVEYFSKNYQVITYDARGFGKSSVPTGPYSTFKDAKSLLDHLRVGKAHVVGLSMGGEIAIEFTISYPDQVISLTLIDSSLDGYASEVDWTVYYPDTKNLEQAKENWLKHELFVGTEHPESLALVKKIVDDYSGWHWKNKDDRKHLHPNARTQLSSITVPTLILVGQHDLAYFNNIAKVLQESITGSKLESIPDAGHMVNLEARNECNRLLEKHFQR